MKEIQLTQGKVALVDDEDFENLNQFKYCTHKEGKTFRAVRKIRVDGKRKMQYMHWDIMGGKYIDHIDHNGLNNQKYNLRFCTTSENGMNRMKQENASSIYKGVSFNKHDHKWTSQITMNQKKIYIGSFIDEIEAAKAYDRKAIELFGEFSFTNYYSGQKKRLKMCCTTYE